MSPPRGVNRDRMVEAMRDLVLAKGFAATTVDDVCDEAGVTKGSFYHHFVSKDEMGRAALDHYFDDLVGAMVAGTYLTVDDPVARLHAFVDHVADVCSGPVMRHGCVLGVFALEVAEQDPDVRALLAERFGQLATTITGLIADAASAAGVDLDASAFADHLLAIIEGGIVLAKAQDDPAVVSRQVRMFGDHLHLLLDQEGR